MVGRLVGALLAIVCVVTAQPRYRVVTYAGVGPAPDGVAATATFLSSPQGLAADAAGNLYVGIVNQFKVKRIDAGTSIVHTIAGNGIQANSGNGGLATKAAILGARYVAVNSAGDVFISDLEECVVHKVDHATQNISIYAGTGACGFSGDHGPATSAMLNGPRGITLDSYGNLYIADYGNQRVRRVDSAAQNITTAAGADPSTHPPYGDSGQATAASLSNPRGVAIDSGGDLYIDDTGHCTIRRVSASTGVIGTYAGVPFACGFGGDGGPATAAQVSGNIRAITFDASDNLYLADGYSRRVRRVDRATQQINTYAGSGAYGFSASAPALQAPFGIPEGVAVDKSTGVLYIADWAANAIAKVVPGNPAMLSLYAGSLGPDGPATSAFLNWPGGLASMNPDFGRWWYDGLLLTEEETGRVREIDRWGNIQTIVGVGMNAKGYSACSVPTNCMLNNPQGIVYDDFRMDYYISDTNNCVIRKLDAGLRMTTVAGTGSCGYDTNAAAASAMLNLPAGIANNPLTGTLYFADTGNNRIRSVTTTDGLIHDIAGTGAAGFNGDGHPAASTQISNPTAISGIANGSSFTTYFADTGNNRIRKVDPSTGIVTTVAGTGVCGYNGDGVAATVQLCSPQGVYVDLSGNVFFADTGNNLIREIPAGTTNLVTIAGNHALGPGYSGDNGDALAAQFNSPSAIAGDFWGNLYISDQGNFAIRALLPRRLITTAASPPAGGVVTPPSGYYYNNDSITFTATANPGYVFNGFSGFYFNENPVPNITVRQDMHMVANFYALQPSMQGAVVATTSGQTMNERDYTLRLTDLGPGNCTVPQIQWVSATPLVGSGTFKLLSALPLFYGAINAGANSSQVLKATVAPTLGRFNLAVSGLCTVPSGQGQEYFSFSFTVTVFR